MAMNVLPRKLMRRPGESAFSADLPPSWATNRSTSPWSNHRPSPLRQASMSTPGSWPRCVFFIFLLHIGQFRFFSGVLASGEARILTGASVEPSSLSASRRSSHSPESNHTPPQLTQWSSSIFSYSTTIMSFLHTGHFISMDSQKYYRKFSQRTVLCQERVQLDSLSWNWYHLLVRFFGRTKIYAVVETGGEQYKVSPGQTIEVEKLTVEGDTVELDKVYMIADGDTVTVGKPTIAGAKVIASVVGAGKKDKVLVYKFKAKVRYRRKRGHRQPFTKLTIKEIVVG